MNDDEDDLNDSDSIKVKSIVGQQNDQKITSATNSNRRRVRVRFAYSFDHDQVLPITQTTLIKTEPCFKVIATEDQVTKHFYQNKSEKYEKTEFIEQKTPSEIDSLDEEFSSQLIRERATTSKIIDTKNSLPHRISSSFPIKSILKKPKKKEEKEKTSISKVDRSLRSHAPSPSSKKKQTSSTRLDFNEVQHLAEITAKQNFSSPSIHFRSLFDQTINIFDPNNSYRITSNTPRPSRLEYYIKPYRGEPDISTKTNRQRSRSLSQQSEKRTHWHQFSNEYVRLSTKQSNRKEHISWSPVRDYVHQGKDHTIITPTKKKETSSRKISSSLLSMDPSLLSSNPCLRNFPSIIPVSIPYRTSPFRSPRLSTDSYETVSIIDRPLTLLSSSSQYNNNKEKKENILKSHSPDIIYQHKKEHHQIMKQYDRLLEKIHTTDEELQSLSRSWMNNTQQRTPVKTDRRSNLSLNKMTSDSHLFSPIILQMCLIILILFNLFVVYFFNEINLWWSEYSTSAVIAEQHYQQTLNF